MIEKCVDDANKSLITPFIPIICFISKIQLFKDSDLFMIFVLLFSILLSQISNLNLNDKMHAIKRSAYFGRRD